MKIVTKEVYICEHCKKLYQVKWLAERHELMCSKNPENYRPCIGCPLLGKRKVSIFHDNPMGGEREEVLELLYCSYKKTFLYPPKTEIKGNAFDLGNKFNDPMPKECDVDLEKEMTLLN